MAKKAIAEVESPDDLTERIFREVEEEYGEGVLVSGTEFIEKKKMVIPWSSSLDIITGGIEEGSWVGITGPEKNGKTVSALTFAANAQRPEYGSRPIFYDKVEGRFSTVHAQGIKGLDFSRGKFHLIQSRKGKILSAQEHLKILENVIKNVPGAVVIIDSISAYLDEKEMNGGIGTETRGGGAKLFSQFIRLVKEVVPVNDIIVIGITQRMANTSGFGQSNVEKAASAWKYQCDYQLQALYKEAWKVGEKQIGLKIRWACKTSKLGPPGGAADGYLRFGVGLDRLFECLNFGQAMGLVKKAGAWLSFEFLKKEGIEPPKFQGNEKAYQALIENPAWADKLQSEVVAMAGGFVGGADEG